jgi:hypothetical protein
MKTSNHSDPLDQKIDALLASRPLKASEDFTARVLAAAEADSTTESHPKQAATKHAPRKLGTLLKFTLPLAAAVALTFSLLQLKTGAPTTAEPTTLSSATLSSATLSSADAQEIFLLKESLSGLLSLGTTEFGSEDLLNTFDALYQEI